MKNILALTLYFLCFAVYASPALSDTAYSLNDVVLDFRINNYGNAEFATKLPSNSLVPQIYTLTKNSDDELDIFIGKSEKIVQNTSQFYVLLSLPQGIFFNQQCINRTRPFGCQFEKFNVSALKSSVLEYDLRDPRAAVIKLKSKEQLNLIAAMQPDGHYKLQIVMVNKGNSSKPVSLDFQNVDLVTLLQVIAEFSGEPIYRSDIPIIPTEFYNLDHPNHSSKSNLSKFDINIKVNFLNMPWEQALETIVDMGDLEMIKHAGAIYIAPKSAKK